MPRQRLISFSYRHLHGINRWCAECMFLKWEGTVDWKDIPLQQKMSVSFNMEHTTIPAISLQNKSFKKQWQLLSPKRKWISPRIYVSDLKLLSDSLRKRHHLLPRAALIFNFFCPEPFNQITKEEMPKNRVCNRWWTSFEVHKEALSTVTSPIPPHSHSHTWNIWMVSRGCVCSGDAEPTLHWSQRPCRSLGTCEGEYLGVCSKTGR